MCEERVGNNIFILDLFDFRIPILIMIVTLISFYNTYPTVYLVGMIKYPEYIQR